MARMGLNVVTADHRSQNEGRVFSYAGSKHGNQGPAPPGLLGSEGAIGTEMEPARAMASCGHGEKLRVKVTGRAEGQAGREMSPSPPLFQRDSEMCPFQSWKQRPGSVGCFCRLIRP